MNKIFVSIASYRDKECLKTVQSLLDNVSENSELIIGIFEQTFKEDSIEVVAPDLLEEPNIRYKRVDPDKGYGIGYARNTVNTELFDPAADFFYQVDSHMRFIKDWDAILLRDYQEGCSLSNTDRVIIANSCYNYWLEGEETILEGMPEPMTSSVKYMAYQTHDLPGAHGERIIYDKPGTPMRNAIHICAGNMFTTSKWVSEVGIDPKMHMDGEEQYMTLDSWIKGYGIWHGREIVSYHYVGSGEYVTKLHYDSVISLEKYAKTVDDSLDTWKDFLASIDYDTKEKFRQYSGVDYNKRRLEERAITRGINIPPDRAIEPYDLGKRLEMGLGY